MAAFFQPVKLASKAITASVNDLEQNWKRLVDLLGGSAYSGGSPYTAGQGQLSAANFKPAAFIGNDAKAEPYSILALQAVIPMITVGGTATGVAGQSGALGVEKVDSTDQSILTPYYTYGAQVTLVGMSFMYGGLAAPGTSITGTVTIALPATGYYDIPFAWPFTNLAPGVPITNTVAASYTPAPLSLRNILQATVNVTGAAGLGAGGHTYSHLVTVYYKALHVA